jgi:hypothetical protein
MSTTLVRHAIREDDLRGVTDAHVNRPRLRRGSAKKRKAAR